MKLLKVASIVVLEPFAQANPEYFEFDFLFLLICFHGLIVVAGG